MIRDLELTIVTRVGGVPVVLARFKDEAMLRNALRHAISAAERQARSAGPAPDLELLLAAGPSRRLM
jgi:hypothetical protein